MGSYCEAIKVQSCNWLSFLPLALDNFYSLYIKRKEAPSVFLPAHRALWEVMLERRVNKSLLSFNGVFVRAPKHSEKIHKFIHGKKRTQGSEKPEFETASTSSHRKHSRRNNKNSSSRFPAKFGKFLFLGNKFSRSTDGCVFRKFRFQAVLAAFAAALFIFDTMHFELLVQIRFFFFHCHD